MKLKYGKKEIIFDLPEEKMAGVITASEKDGLENPLQSVKKQLEDPLGSPSLEEMVRARDPEKIVIIVNDVSRPTPYNYMLPPLLEKLKSAGIKKEQITFIIATGVHEPHTTEQNVEIFGEEVTDNYRFVFHNCDEDLINLGTLSSGNELYLNREVVEADFVITTGVILPHYFAGFSGGRKSILPGVSGRETIQFNHCRMVELMDKLPPIDKNPVSLEMIEAANRVGVDFILNVVTNSRREIVKVVAGDMEKAWAAGIDCSASMYHIPMKERADVAIVSAGGYPRDINVYQAQKALDHADRGTKPGGVIILVADCKEGLGEMVFEEWMKDAIKPEDNVERIKKGFVIGGHKAFAICKVAMDKEVILISDMDCEMTEMLFMKKMETIDEAIDYIEKKYNGDYRALIMPQGSLTVPVVE